MGVRIKQLNNKHTLSLASNILTAIIGLVIFAVLNRVLSLEANGVWIVFQSTYLLADTFRSGFLSTAFVTFYVGKRPEEAIKVAGSAWYIGLCITLFFLLLSIPGYFLSQYIHDVGFALFTKWFGLAFLASLPYLMATCILQAEERFDRLLILRLINQVFFVAGILLFFYLDDIRIEDIVYAYIGSLLISSSYVLVSGWSKFGTIRHKTKENIAELYHFGKYSVGTILSTNLFRTIDIYVINLFLAPSAVAIYNLGLRLIEVIEIPMRSLIASGMPMMVTAFNEDNRKKVIEIMSRFITLLTVGMVPIILGVVLFADIPVALVGGGKFVGTEAANVLRGFIIIALLYPTDRFMALTLDVIRQAKMNFYKILVMLVVNLVADVVAVYYFGNIYGIVIAAIFPVLVAIVMGYAALQNYQPFGFLRLYVKGWINLKQTIADFRGKK
mgnify:CR=1 FL=1